MNKPAVRVDAVGGRDHVLTRKQCEEINKLYQSGHWSQAKLGEMFSVNHSQISRIVNGWRPTRQFNAQNKGTRMSAPAINTKEAIDNLTDRMNRLVLSTSPAGASAAEILAQALMAVAANMPTEPRRSIARLLDAYDMAPKNHN